MLDQSTLAQLSQLKTAIIASKEYGEGTVVGAKGSFGFVKLEDGRDAFLSADKMQRVLPGDRVKILITKNAKDQLEAQLEALLSPSLKRFVAQYIIKDHNHFVLPQADNFNRWLFVPPQLRGKCQNGDYVLAELINHPYADGKATAKVVARLGQPSDPYIEHKIVIARHGLYRYWHKDTLGQMEGCAAAALELDEREDHTHTPFVTIDGASTQDMDDAVYCEHTPDGFQLQVAIADPASFIAPSSHLGKAARDHAQTLYLPGENLCMLPERLATYSFSLMENQIRPALICHLQVSTSGEVTDRRFSLGKIRSHHKLNYTQVAAFLKGDLPINASESIHNSLRALEQLALVRYSYRERHHWLPDDQPDYSLLLNPQGKIDHIEKRERNIAHRMIEEAMLLTNQSAGQLLAQHGLGIHMVHLGFRSERLGEVKALLKEEFGQPPEADITTLEGFLSLVHSLRENPEKAHLLAPLKRMMRTSEPSGEPGPHMGLGFNHYATVTSPIRRFADLYNHWAISHILKNQKTQSASPKYTEHLQETLNKGRLALRELELWLACDYLQHHIGLEDNAYIRIITPQGFGVKLHATGLEGFVQFDKKQAKTYDAKRMTLKVNDTLYRLDETVSVKVLEVDVARKRVKLGLV